MRDRSVGGLSSILDAPQSRCGLLLPFARLYRIITVYEAVQKCCARVCERRRFAAHIFNIEITRQPLLWEPDVPVGRISLRAQPFGPPTSPRSFSFHSFVCVHTHIFYLFFIAEPYRERPAELMPSEFLLDVSMLLEFIQVRYCFNIFFCSYRILFSFFWYVYVYIFCIKFFFFYYRTVSRKVGELTQPFSMYRC